MLNSWLHWWAGDQALLIQPTFIRLFVALVLGSLIGAERQWRQRAAGLRTNTLVCFGSAAFVDLGSVIGGANTTNVIAYVISGVGFLGAGAIMKEGGSIRGLNTAATLWCSAAVGACAGSGQLSDATFVAVLLLTINVALRPLSRWIDVKSAFGARRLGVYRVSIACSRSNEQAVSALIMRALAARPLTLRQLRTEETEESNELLIEVLVESSRRGKILVDELTRELRLDPDVNTVEWGESSLDAE